MEQHKLAEPEHSEQLSQSVLIRAVLSFVPHYATEHGVRPWGLKWRSSVWFVTLVVGLGITTDLLVYAIVIPVLPFYLESLNYTGVSRLVGYLQFAFSGGVVFSTPVIAWFSERYNLRQMPLVAGLVALIGSQIMLMLAPAYWVMVLARVIQGVSSSMVWVVALALVCDSTPERNIGQQLGIAMSGLSLGLLIGVPAGGALYGRWGYHSPFYFSMVITVIDLVGRLLVIERKDAIKWGVDPAADIVESNVEVAEMTPTIGDADTICQAISTEDVPENDRTPSIYDSRQRPSTEGTALDKIASMRNPERTKERSMLTVVLLLMKSPRTLTALFITVIYGIAYAGQEPILALHLQAVFGFGSTKVGLIALGGIFPTLVSSPLAGWWSDKKGAEWAMIVCLGLSLPWWGLVTIDTSLALFIVSYAFECTFAAAAVSPLSAELAAVSRSMEGVGYAHVYGAFNIFYGVGSALGPLISGQIYSRVKDGWFVFNMIALGLVFVSSLVSIVYVGEWPLLYRFSWSPWYRPEFATDNMAARESTMIPVDEHTVAHMVTN